MNSWLGLMTWMSFQDLRRRRDLILSRALHQRPSHPEFPSYLQLPSHVAALDNKEVHHHRRRQKRQPREQLHLHNHRRQHKRQHRQERHLRSRRRQHKRKPRQQHPHIPRRHHKRHLQPSRTSNNQC